MRGELQEGSGGRVPATLRAAVQRSIGDAFILERELAESPSAHLFVALECALDRRVVLKVLPLEVSTTLDTTRFRREIHLTAQLAHPNIVPVLAAGESGGFLYYTMPFVDGESLHAQLKRRRMLPVTEVVSMLRDLTRALAYAHAHGVLHRDVKPDNVLLESGAALLTDFGIAKALAESQPPSYRTAPGMAIGTPTYVSPEQAAGSASVDARTDLYSLGVVAYEMLTGGPPFAYTNLRALLSAHLHERPPALPSPDEGLPSWLNRLVMRLLAKDPDDRPDSAIAALQLLDASVTIGA